MESDRQLRIEIIVEKAEALTKESYEFKNIPGSKQNENQKKIRQTLRDLQSEAVQILLG